MAGVSTQAGAVTAPQSTTAQALQGFLYHMGRAALIYKVEKELSGSGVLYHTFSKIRSLSPFPTPLLFFKYNSKPTRSAMKSQYSRAYRCILLTVCSTGYKGSFNLIRLCFSLCSANASSLFLYFSLQLCSSLLVYTTISKT